MVGDRVEAARVDHEITNNAARLIGGLQLAQSGERRIETLVEVSRNLGESPDSKPTLAKVTRLLVPALADWAAMDSVDQPHRMTRIASAFGDAVTPGLRRVVERSRFARALGDARSARILTEESRQSRALAKVGLTSIMVAPLRSRGRLLGSLALGSARGNRQFVALDLALVNNLATLCALIIDNSQLYRAAHQAIATHDAFLLAVSHELRTPLCHVKGFAKTLRQRDVFFEPAAREDFLAELEHEVDRLTRVIETLID